MSTDQLSTFNKIKSNITRKFGLDMWKLICFDEALSDPFTLYDQLTHLYELKINVLSTFGESTWRFLLKDEFGSPFDENGDFVEPSESDSLLR